MGRVAVAAAAVFLFGCVNAVAAIQLPLYSTASVDVDLTAMLSLPGYVDEVSATNVSNADVRAGLHGLTIRVGFFNIDPANGKYGIVRALFRPYRESARMTMVCSIY